jgi:hypothetical protein
MYFCVFFGDFLTILAKRMKNRIFLRQRRQRRWAEKSPG